MPTGAMYRKLVGPVGGGRIKENVAYRGLGNDFAQNEQATVAHLLSQLIPVVVGLRVERLPRVSHLNVKVDRIWFALNLRSK